MGGETPPLRENAAESQSVGRDSYLDIEMWILGNRPTEVGFHSIYW